MRYIGDVHGKYKQYKRIISNCPESIQVGDMGVGFFHERDSDYPLQNPPYDHMTRGNHRFIRGNHDNPEVCRKHTQWIYDGMTEIGQNRMFVGGALSIDKQWRVEGASWWADEELSISDLNVMISRYESFKPRTMITHDCPEYIARYLFNENGKFEFPSRTRQAFGTMLELHRPEYWIFGHWHTSKNEVIDGCRFICLAELEFIDIEA